MQIKVVNKIFFNDAEENVVLTPRQLKLEEFIEAYEKLYKLQAYGEGALRVIHYSSNNNKNSYR